MRSKTRTRILAFLVLTLLVPGLVLAQYGGWEYHEDWYARYGGVEVYAGPSLLQGQVADGTIAAWRAVQIDASGGLIQAVAADDTDILGILFGGKSASSGDVVLVATRGETDANIQGPVQANDSLKVGLSGKLIARSPSTTYGTFTGEADLITQPGSTGTVTATASVASDALVTVYGVDGGGDATSVELDLAGGTSVTETLDFDVITAIGLDAAASAVITVTSGSMETAIDAGDTGAGLATLTTAQTQGHNLALNVAASGSSTKVVVVRGTNSAGAAATEVLTLSGATPVAGSVAWAEIDQVEIGNVEDSRTVTLTHDPETGPVIGRVLEAGGDDAVVRVMLEPDRAITAGLIPSGVLDAVPYSSSLTFEGATDNAYETTLSVTDPTADRTATLPDASGTVMLSTLATNAPDAANSVWGASNALVWEGSGVDAYETSLSATNPTADRAIVLPDLAGTVHVNEASQALTAGAGTFNSDVSVTGDVSVAAESTGGNAGARNEVSGLWRSTFIDLGAGTNGATETVSYIDANPTGEWAEVDAGTNITVTADTSIYRHTTNSLKIEFTAVITSEGVDGTIAQDDLSANESMGFWIYSTEALAEGDFDVTLDDTDGTDQSYDVPAVSAEVWTWVEFDISGCGANCDTVDGVQFLATAQGAASLTAVDIYLDGMYKWDADDEEDLGLAILQDGVISVLALPTAAGSDNEWSLPVENTDFFVVYRDGADALVWITDQSAKDLLVFVAY